MNTIREQLESLSETDYKKFNEKIVPGARNMLGVRLPKLRQIAKEIAKQEPVRYLEEIEQALRTKRDQIY